MITVTNGRLWVITFQVRQGPSFPITEKSRIVFVYIDFIIDNFSPFEVCFMGRKTPERSIASQGHWH